MKNTPHQGFLRLDKNFHTEQREVQGLFNIGRGEDNDLILQDPFASRYHARIEQDANSGFFTIRDLKSQNGVFLNGNRVYRAVLSHNDRILIGKTEFFFSFERFDENWKLRSQSANTRWNEQLARVPYIAQNDYPILILGESGTGKEVLAKLIHRRSKRSSGPMISINCSALTESLVESELFGHIRGSYTGANQDRKGAFLAAKGGTLFLDEIGDLPLNLQPKLLRAIEYQEVKPVGSDIPIKTDVRIIAATHQKLREKITNKEFRDDLYYRLNVVTLNIPSLEDRMEDFQTFARSFALKFGVNFSENGFKALENYSWPGNIRELKNTVLRAKALFSSQVVGETQVSMILDQSLELHGRAKNFASTSLQNIEKNLILKTLEKYRGSQIKTANELKIPCSTLHGKLKKHKINPKDFKQSLF